MLSTQTQFQVVAVSGSEVGGKGLGLYPAPQVFGAPQGPEDTVLNVALRVWLSLTLGKV